MVKGPLLFGSISAAAAYFVFDASKKNVVIAGIVAGSALWLALKFIHPIQEIPTAPSTP